MPAYHEFAGNDGLVLSHSSHAAT